MCPLITAKVLWLAAVFCFGIAAYSVYLALYPSGEYADRSLNWLESILPAVAFAVLGMVLLFAGWALPHEVVWLIGRVKELKNQPASPLTIISVMVGVLLLLLAWGQLYWSCRLRRWAASNGWRLLNWRGFPGYKSPWAGSKTKFQRTFLVRVEEPKGEVREAYLLIGNRMGISPRDVDLVWKE